MLDELIAKNPQIVEKAKKCKNKEELTNLLKSYNISMDNEVIEKLYDYLNKTELNEDDLDSVAGGGEFGKTLDECTAQEAMDIIKNGGKAYYLDSNNYYVDMNEVDWNEINKIMNSKE